MKLKKLILSGFKSFADRTTFEFDDGVTCVVGPNGCGKSNLVDAVKWVLGAQSARSLRGSEMADVIFNGSAVRRAAGSAEVTLVFDNSTGQLQPDLTADGNGDRHVVSVTRRLYRSGQSDYLINKVSCRLKDIREMFMDTGIGNDAYSLIEQGRVERFLQASHDERRALFDEAAGISKYKARKTEALRKLERVEQNLLRLTDILAEVEKRLRSIKYQAGKARNYQAYSQRLRELRLLHFLAQYHGLSRHRHALRAKLDAGSDALAAISARIDRLEAARSGAEVELVDLERTSRQLQAEIAAVGGQITACEQRAEMLTARAAELGEQIVAASARCEELEAKVESCQNDIDQRNVQLRQLEVEAAEQSSRYDAVCEERQSGELAITHLTAALEDEKAGTVDLLRRTAQLHNEIHGLGIRRESLSGQKARLASRAEQITDALRQMYTDRAKVQTKLDDVTAVLSASQAKLEEAKQASQEAFEQEQALADALAESRERRSARQSRVEVLQEMQQRLEGVAQGVRRVLRACREGRIRAVRGMLGSFLETDLRHAPVVEASLAGADQHLVADRYEDVAAAAQELTGALGDGGGVEVLCLDRLAPLRDDFDCRACPQVLSRVIDWVRFEPWLAPAMWRLLGKTLVVRDLADAAAARWAAPPGFRFVTLDGQVLEPDGRVRFGAAGHGAGVIARRSELAALAAETARLDERIAELERRRTAAHDQSQHLHELQQKLRTAIYEANTERVECDSRLARCAEQIDQLEREKPVVAEDIQGLAEEIDAAVRAEHQAKQTAAELERLNAERQGQIEKLERQIAAGRQRQEELSRQATELKVALAQAEQRKLALTDALAALVRQRDQRAEDLQAGRAEIDLNRRRRAEAEAAAAEARREIDRLYERQVELNREAEDAEESRRSLQERIEEVRRELAEQRKAQQAAAEQVNACRVELSEVDVRIEGFIGRAADEMQMDLLESYRSYQHDEQRDWDAVAAEIRELRRKIERLGNVNLDAIPEQDELTSRREFLAGQLDDVRASQHKLQDLIRKINRESRRRFEATFQAVRENFRQLFRKLFGGGRADILLLEPEDVLESKIEILAQPPGKELRSLTLLSGGEKTMTALALLFSFFRTRPSPFCLLDEVDAALDEANNDRFNHLLREFVADSQFIIISHAKRTMGMANVLYGVTMQEPGISKRISVRFEDAGEQLEQQLEPVTA